MRRLSRLQATLGLLWLLGGLLQLQPANLGASFSRSIVDNAMGQPGWVQTMVTWTGAIFAEHPLAADLGVATVQLVLGLAILHPGTRRVGLLLSVPWALGVWALGEAFGNLASGFAMLPSGGPGAALLYALAAIVLLPRRSPDPQRACDARAAASYGTLGARGSAGAWGVLWASAAMLQAIPVESLGFKLSANFQMASLGEPAALAAVDHAAGRFAGGHGPEVTAVLVALELAIGAAALVEGAWRARLLLLALVACPVLWVVGENLGGLLTGAASDVGAMPLYVLLALALLPGRDQPLAATPVSAASDSSLAGSWRQGSCTTPAERRRARSALGTWNRPSRSSIEPPPTHIPPSASVG